VVDHVRLRAAPRAEVESILKLAGSRAPCSPSPAVNRTPCRVDLEDFADIGRRPRAGTPYAFLATRIHDDFALIRDAIQSAVEGPGHPVRGLNDPRVCCRAGRPGATRASSPSAVA
jgi:hypothetical protein